MINICFITVFVLKLFKKGFYRISILFRYVPGLRVTGFSLLTTLSLRNRIAAMILQAIFFLLLPAYAHSSSMETEQNPQVLFNRGNFKMEHKNYPGALEIFHAIEDKGYFSGPLYLNMAISYVYLDSLGKASLYFRKSSGFKETEVRAKEGISYIEDRLKDRGTVIPSLSRVAFIDWLLFKMNHYFWIFCGIVLLNTGVLMLLTGWLFLSNRWFALSGTATAIAGIALFVLSVSVHVWAQGYQQVVIVEKEVPLRPCPEDVFDEEQAVDLIFEAHTVTLIKRTSRIHNKWVYIRLRNGISGWVPEKAIRII